MRESTDSDRHRQCERESKLTTLSITVGVSTDSVTPKRAIIMPRVCPKVFTLSVYCLYTVCKVVSKSEAKNHTVGTLSVRLERGGKNDTVG
jgi:hypothetical protein